VTGGSRGIGAEIVRRLAAEGADVAFTYRTGRDEAEQLAGQVRGFGRRALMVQADLAESAVPATVAGAAVGEFGRLDILVNNAGITHWGPVAQTSVEDFDRLVAVDARAPFLMMQAVAGLLADGGRVVNIRCRRAARAGQVRPLGSPGAGQASGAAGAGAARREAG
jgi:3-oxoacyl-[acyl-carrier protein] reductase